jgi:hypothetical protein
MAVPIVSTATFLIEQPGKATRRPVRKADVREADFRRERRELTVLGG